MDCLTVLLISLFLQLQILPLKVYSTPSVSKENDIFDSSEDEDEENARSNRGTSNDNLKPQVTTSETFITATLAAINKYRGLHGVAALDLDYKLALEAEEWASFLAKKTDSEKKPYLKPSWTYLTGETIFAVYSNSSDSVTGDQVADNWYIGCKSHDWVENYFSKKSSRFSQLVWKDSQRMGIGKATASTKGIVIAVARYYPAGNWGYRSSFQKDKSDKCQAVVEASKARSIGKEMGTASKGIDISDIITSSKEKGSDSKTASSKTADKVNGTETKEPTASIIDTGESKEIEKTNDTAPAGRSFAILGNKKLKKGKSATKKHISIGRKLKDDIVLKQPKNEKDEQAMAAKEKEKQLKIAIKEKGSKLDKEKKMKRLKKHLEKRLKNDKENKTMTKTK